MKTIRLLLVLLSILCFSCEQEQQQVNPSFHTAKSKDALVALAKQNYELKLSNEKDYKNEAINKRSHATRLDRKVLWKNSFIQEVKGKRLLVTPITILNSPYTYLEEGSRISLANASLLVSSISADSADFEVLIKLPDLEYLRKRKRLS